MKSNNNPLFVEKSQQNIQWEYFTLPTSGRTVALSPQNFVLEIGPNYRLVVPIAHYTGFLVPTSSQL